MESQIAGIQERRWLFFENHGIWVGEYVFEKFRFNLFTVIRDGRPSAILFFKKFVVARKSEKYETSSKIYNALRKRLNCAKIG